MKLKFLLTDCEPFYSSTSALHTAEIGICSNGAEKQNAHKTTIANSKWRSDFKTQGLIKAEHAENSREL